MTKSARVALGLLTILMAIPAARAGEEGIGAKDAFARLKTLAGDWKVAGPDEHHGTRVSYKVTAAGSAVMQTQFPGTGHEMVTIYHLDGDELLATHYCALGNQPRMKLDRKGSGPDRLSFVFDGGTNLDPKKDMHIHAFRIAFLEAGKVEEEWDGYQDGKMGHSSKFAMSRP